MLTTGKTFKVVKLSFIDGGGKMMASIITAKSVKSYLEHSVGWRYRQLSTLCFFVLDYSVLSLYNAGTLLLML